MIPDDNVMTPFSPTAFRDLIYAILNRQEPPQWTIWLPVATVALQGPEKWIEGFTHLSLEKQYDLLEILSHPHSGPFADALLSLLAEYSHAISDEQVRLNILDAAVETHKRQEQRVLWIHDHVQTLADKIEKHQDRVKDDFDHAMEIARLETALAELRAKEFYTQDSFSEIHALEGEILHLETMQRVCNRYEKDRPEREAYLVRLKGEVEKLHVRKKETETAIGENEAILNKLRKETEAVEREMEKRQKEKADLLEKKKERESTIRKLKDDVVKLKDERTQRRAERQNILDEFERLKGEIEERNALIKKERKNLEGLKADAETGGLSDIVNKIEELYRILPQDKADEGIISRTRRRQ